MSSWRGQYEERDLSQFATIQANETGAMVIKSRKGPSTPKKVTASDATIFFGNPSSTYNEVFELLAFSKAAPCWAVSAIGEGALYGGVDILPESVVGFGVGRDFDTYDYTTVARYDQENIGTGNGVVQTFSGITTHTPIINTDNISFTVAGKTSAINCDETGTLSGADITAGNIDLDTGEYSLTFSGTPGSYASITSTVDFSDTIDLSGSTKYINIIIDGTVKTINLGSSSTTTKNSVIDAINSAFGITVAESSGNFIKITGKRGSTLGNVTVAAPSSGDSALTLCFSATGQTLSNTGISPTGKIPSYGQSILLDYNYSVDNTDISHSLFTISPYEDDLAVVVLSKGGYKFEATLYEITSSGGYSQVGVYDYSLIREKDGFGTSLYYEDVFRNDTYLQIKINPNFINVPYNITSTTKVDFSGGNRGEDPTDADYTAAWGNFNYASKYPARIFMDVHGTEQITLNNIIQTYQPKAQGISIIPRGNNASDAITFRSNLGLDSDDVCLYTNWAKIEDDFNNSFAWISHIGSIGRKFALMYDTWDAASPAGIDENGHGGQISDWNVLEMENEYTDIPTGGGELQLLDQSQINPFIKDDVYGVMAYGDRTLQVTNSDTSFVGTRRLYKNISEAVQTQVLRLQEFKNNDTPHQRSARIRTQGIVDPILAAGWLREATVICDDTNNTDAVKNRREFVLDIYVKVTPNSQRTKLRLTRLAQNQTVAEVVAV